MADQRKAEQDNTRRNEAEQDKEHDKAGSLTRQGAVKNTDNSHTPQYVNPEPVVQPLLQSHHVGRQVGTVAS